MHKLKSFIICLVVVGWFFYAFHLRCDDLLVLTDQPHQKKELAHTHTKELKMVSEKNEEENKNKLWKNFNFFKNENNNNIRNDFS